MQKRIRYVKQNDKLVNKNVITAGGEAYRVEIVDNKFSIYDTTGLIHTGEKNTAHEVRKAVKKQLVEIGVRFAEESRNKPKPKTVELTNEPIN